MYNSELADDILQESLDDGFKSQVRHLKHIINFGPHPFKGASLQYRRFPSEEFKELIDDYNKNNKEQINPAYFENGFSIYLDEHSDEGNFTFYEKQIIPQEEKPSPLEIALKETLSKEEYQKITNILKEYETPKTVEPQNQRVRLIKHPYKFDIRTLNLSLASNLVQLYQKKAELADKLNFFKFSGIIVSGKFINQLQDSLSLPENKTFLLMSKMNEDYSLKFCVKSKLSQDRYENGVIKHDYEFKVPDNELSNIIELLNQKINQITQNYKINTYGNIQQNQILSNGSNLYFSNEASRLEDDLTNPSLQQYLLEMLTVYSDYKIAVPAEIVELISEKQEDAFDETKYYIEKAEDGLYAINTENNKEKYQININSIDEKALFRMCCFNEKQKYTVNNIENNEEFKVLTEFFNNRSNWFFEETALNKNETLYIEEIENKIQSSDEVEL